MARIIIELNAIEDIKTNLESLIQRSQKIGSTEINKLVRQRRGLLDKNEQMVFDCIKEKEEQSKQYVVNSLQKSLSRRPVFKAIKSLIDRNMVIEKPDPSNKQRLLLYVNRDNLILQVERDIRNFKRSYLKLIKRTHEEYFKKQDLTQDEIKNSKQPALDIAEFYSSGVEDGLTKIFKQLIINYSLKAIFKWPQEIKDVESLNRLYLMVFQSLNEIFSELVKYVPFDTEDKNRRIAYLHEGLNYSIEDAKIYQEMIPEFDGYNAGPEFDAVMSSLFTAIKMNVTWENYRAGQLDEPPSSL